MGSDTAVVVRYWIATDHPVDFPDLDGIEEFRNDLAAEYVSLVRGRPSGAGGLLHLCVEIISRFPISHVIQLLIDGAAYDLIKEGSRSLILRPFIAAYKKLRERNVDRLLDIQELRIEFADCQLTMHEVSTNTVIENLQQILAALAEHYDHLARRTGELPYEVHIPVLEDHDEERKTRFRILGNVDEPITGRGPEDYFRYWGIVYGRPWERSVYDVRAGKLLADEFTTVQEYWQTLSRRRRKGNDVTA